MERNMSQICTGPAPVLPEHFIYLSCKFSTDEREGGKMDSPSVPDERFRCEGLPSRTAPSHSYCPTIIWLNSMHPGAKS